MTYVCLLEIAAPFSESVAKLPIGLDHYILLQTEIHHTDRFIYMMVMRQSDRG